MREHGIFWIFPQAFCGRTSGKEELSGVRMSLARRGCRSYNEGILSPP